MYDSYEAPYENTALSLDKINTPPAGSDFALRASQGQSRIFAPLTSFSMYDSYEAPYENTALSLDK